MVAIALIVFSVAVYVSVKAFLLRSLERSLQTSASSILTDYVKPLESKGAAWFQSEMTESYPSGISDIFVRVSRGKSILYQSGDARESQASTPSFDPNHGEAISGLRSEGMKSGQQMLIYQLSYQERQGARFLIETGAPITPISKILRSLFLILLIGTPAVIAIAGVGGYLLMSRALLPVVTLTAWAERVGRADLGERLPVIPSGDELERLSLALNGMIERLEQTVEHNRRFSADASHELRTPLTIIRGELEVMLQTPMLPVAIAEGIGSALEESSRMSHIVEGLMAIARLEGGGEQMQMVPVDLVSIARVTLDHMCLLAEEKKIVLLCGTREKIHVTGDAMRLKQVVANLLDNAIKYTTPHGSIHLSVFAEGAYAVLEISDTGIGIPKGSLPFLFERFYRVDSTRSRNSGGMGLGLSIVKSICVAHGGDICVSSVEGKGTTMRVNLPLAPDRKLEGNEESMGFASRGDTDLVSTETEDRRTITIL